MIRFEGVDPGEISPRVNSPAGYQQLEDIEPITVAAYIETLQRHAAPPTVKQHMATIRTTKLYDHRGQKVLLEDSVLKPPPRYNNSSDLTFKTTGHITTYSDNGPL